MRRSHNQDSHATLPASDAEQYLARGHVFLVADGMGAHAVGELASKLAADSIPHIYSKHAQEGPVAALRKAFVEANQNIHNRGQANREFEGMGTTATAILLRPEGAWVGHVGDSRAYRIRDGKIEQLSFDHSLIWELARRQRKAPEELQGIPPNVIVRSLGPDATVQVDVEGPHPLQPGDTFLLCSDGLSGPVSDRELGAVAATLPPDEACRFLIQLANMQGGPDNITCLIVRVIGKQTTVNSDGSIIVKTSSFFELPPEPMSERLRRWPWAIILLSLGIVLAAVAIWITASQLPGALATFLLAGLSLLAGVVALMVQQHRESQEEVEPLEDRPLQVYRQTPCTIDAAMIQRLDEALGILQQRIRDNRWSADERLSQHYHDIGNQAQAQGDLHEAFRAHCRALLVLMEAIHRQQGKAESFKPMWDRPPP
ncbi:MAG: protein phosphatase 2C domain-containing protein [Gemmataceae bacterium]|nr:protein phosphatase 2C domain-containing protein [Gemmataceae bacterium]